MCFKDVLSTRRKDLNLTQKDLAEKLNVSNKTISKWENGGSYPDLPILIKLAEILELNFNDLLVENGKTNYEEGNKDIINKFKLISFITFGLVILSLIFSLNIENNLLIAIFSICLILSLSLYYYNSVSFRSYYIVNYYTREYELLYYKFTIILLLLYSSISCIVIYSNIRYIFDLMHVNYKSIILVIIFTVFLFSIILYLTPRVIKRSNIKIKNDLLTKLFKIIFTIFSVITLIAIQLYILTQFNVISDNIYLIPSFYRILLFGTLTSYAIVINRYKYYKT